MQTADRRVADPAPPVVIEQRSHTMRDDYGHWLWIAIMAAFVIFAITAWIGVLVAATIRFIGGA